MVLVNFELWAADGSSGSSLPLDFESNNPHTRHLNPFDPRVIPQSNSNLNHLSSNGYYGFSYVNSAHDIELNNNNNNYTNNNNNSNINHNNNNNSTTCNLMANDVNGMHNTFTTQQTQASAVNFGSAADAAVGSVNIARCKKRSFVTNDDHNDCTATDNGKVYNKRCRFDDDLSAQYCNDFFQLPSTQIATQSCLMDTEEGQPPQQYNLHQQQQCHQLLQSQQQQQQQQPQHPQQQQHDPQQQHLYHQQQHFQDIQFATIKCHFKHDNNCDTLALNNHTCSCKNLLEKNTENVFKNHKPDPNNSIQIENGKYDNDVANDELKVDDAMLFAQLHGGCLHHHFNSTIAISGDYIVKKNAMDKHLQDDNFYKKF